MAPLRLRHLLLIPLATFLSSPFLRPLLTADSSPVVMGGGAQELQMPSTGGSSPVCDVLTRFRCDEKQQGLQRRDNPGMTLLPVTLLVFKPNKQCTG